MINLNTITYSDIEKIEKKFKKGGSQKQGIGHKIVEGSKDSKILISCPHSVSQIRKGKTKKRELFLGTISLYLQELTGCHLIYKTRNMDDDANTSAESKYRDDIRQYVIDNNIELVIDLHGSESRLMDVEIGTYHGFNIDNNKTIVKNLYNVLIDNDITSIRCDKINFAGKGTLAHFIKSETDVNAIQIEIGKRFRWPKTRIKSFKTIIAAFQKYIISFDYGGASIQIKARNYFLDYDSTLDIKPSFGYTRELGLVPNNHIGMELEIGINYEKEKYSFIKKLLKKIKKTVGKKGYFVHDFTVISDYSFEIVFDPMPVDELIKMYADIMAIISHSSNQLFSHKNYNCGIHLNFNKKEIEDLDVAHKKLINLMFNEKKYFNYNLYKKSKFRTTYKEYLDFQRSTGSKYVAINYSNKKIIEIRNIKAGMDPLELKEVSDKILNILYGIPYEKEEKEYVDFIDIYEKALKRIKVKEAEKILENDYILITNIKTKPIITDIDSLGKKGGKK